MPVVAIHVMVFLLATSPGLAQDAEPGLPSEQTPTAPDAGKPRTSHVAFTQAELDQMLAPIALYPDSLLSQILIAATYPVEVVEAARWSRANSTLTGDQAVQAAAGNTWDPSVTALVAFPQIVQTMDENLYWMERLGDAFLSQRSEVMDTVQGLRQKASAAGHLASDDNIRVDQQGQSIVIEPANPQVVYVPYYDPITMYGPWWWPAYPPIYWRPWPGYVLSPGFGAGFAWGVGIPIGPGYFYGIFNWPLHRVVLPGGGLWAHDPIHRRGVPYRDPTMRQQFGRMGISPEARREFSGHDPLPFQNRSGFAGQPGSHPGFGNPPHVGGESRAGVPLHAFEGIGHGAAERQFSERGQRSFRGAGSPGGLAPRSFGGSHGAGGGGGHHH